LPNPGSPTIITSCPSPWRGPVPAAQQHRHFVVTADQRRKITVLRAPSAAARPHQLEQGGGLGHALERVRATLFRNEQARDLTLHPRRDQHRARLGQRLHSRSDIGDVAVDLPCRIEHGGPGFEADAGCQHWLVGTLILTV
jgi:hypothetical protein